MNEHKNSGWAVFFAVFCGVICGWVVGHFLSAHLTPDGGWLAWAGCVVAGGLSGYVLVDPWGFIAKIPVALKTAWKEFSFAPTEETRARNKFVWQNKGTLALYVLVNLSWWGCLYCGIRLESIFHNSGVALYALVCAFVGISAVACLFHSLIVVVEFAKLFDVYKSIIVDSLYVRLDQAKKDLEETRIILIKAVNPFSIFFLMMPFIVCFLAKQLALLLLGLVMAVPSIISFCLRTLWHAYKLTHTSARLIAMGDATLFAGAVYFTESVWVALSCAVIGGLWGVINLIVIAPRLVPIVEPLFVAKE